jgi:hypothetical protein
VADESNDAFVSRCAPTERTDPRMRGGGESNRDA